MMRWMRFAALVIGLYAVAAHAGPGAARGRSSMEAHVDPQTGRFVPEPITPVPQRLPAASPSVAPEIPAPGGGMMVVLDGAFMSDLVATVEPDGTLRMRCTTREPHDPPRP